MKSPLATRPRQRAPSRKSLETRARILSAAEHLFAERGFEGASIREIAKSAGVTVALVHHHGRGKEELFHTVVYRRAEELSTLRLKALEDLRRNETPTLRGILACFIDPFLDKVQNGGQAWSDYGRLIAHVSADERWRPIAETCFDPTAKIFIDELARAVPYKPKEVVAAQFVFMVSALLSVTTSTWRIDALSADKTGDELGAALTDFLVAGFSG